MSRKSDTTNLNAKHTVVLAFLVQFGWDKSIRLNLNDERLDTVVSIDPQANASFSAEPKQGRRLFVDRNTDALFVWSTTQIDPNPTDFGGSCKGTSQRGIPRGPYKWHAGIDFHIMATQRLNQNELATFFRSFLIETCQRGRSPAKFACVRHELQMRSNPFANRVCHD